MQRFSSAIGWKLVKNHVVKRCFAWISEPRYDDEYGWMISISSRKAVNVSEFRGEPSVSIREYVKMDTYRTASKKKDIFLTDEKYNASMQCEDVSNNYKRQRPRK